MNFFSFSQGKLIGGYEKIQKEWSGKVPDLRKKLISYVCVGKAPSSPDNLFALKSKSNKVV
jgi:hypothetical protein